MKISESKSQLVNSIPSALCIDRDEYEAAIRTAKAQVLARSLGVKLPYRIAKKWYCRCGRVDVFPEKFLAHRLTCEVLHKRDKEIIDRKPKEKVVVIEVKKKIKETYPCIGCDFAFAHKQHLK